MNDLEQREVAEPAASAAALERYDQEVGGASISIRTLDDIKRISLIFVKSGMFKADRHADQQTKMYQAGVKIIAGVEFGIQPFAAMRGINIINGNAEMSANLMAAKVKNHPRYDYRVKQLDNDACVLEFYELTAGTPDLLGESSFTKDDAARAGLTGENWRKFPRNMYFARALSNGVRVYTPDIFYGAPVYVEGEIGGDFDSPAQAPTDSGATDEAAPLEGEVLSGAVGDAEQIGEPADDDEAVRQNIAAHLAALNLPDHRVRQLIRETTGKPFLANCGEEDLVKLAEEVERIESGERELEPSWYEASVSESKS